MSEGVMGQGNRRTDALPDLDGMVRRTGEHVNRILRENLYEMNLDAARLKRLARQKNEMIWQRRMYWKFCRKVC